MLCKLQYFSAFISAKTPQQLSLNDVHRHNSRKYNNINYSEHINFLHLAQSKKFCTRLAPFADKQFNELLPNDLAAIRLHAPTCWLDNVYKANRLEVCLVYYILKYTVLKYTILYYTLLCYTINKSLS